MHQKSFRVQTLQKFNTNRPLKDAGGSHWKETVAKRELYQDLDPEKREFNCPDFGFNDELNFTKSQEQQIGIWMMLYDYIKIHPKYERLRNILQTMTH